MRAFNIKQTYVDGDDPWLDILYEETFVICSTTNRLKGYSPGQLVFGRDITLLIKHKLDWELIRQKNQTQINKENIHKNIKRVDHDYKVGDKFMLNNTTAYKYKTPFKGPFVITQCWNNGTVTLQYGTTNIRYNIRRLSHTNLIQTLKILTPKICMTMSTYDCQLYTFIFH